MPAIYNIHIPTAREIARRVSPEALAAFNAAVGDAPSGAVVAIDVNTARVVTVYR